MKKSSKIKKPKIELMYAYKVQWHQFNEVRIQRLQVLSMTKNKVTYINAHGSEFTGDRIGYSDRWFKSRKRAKAFATKLLQDRIEFYEGVLSQLHAQVKKLKPKK